MQKKNSPVNFAAVGLNHGHIYGLVKILQDAGAKLSAFYAREPELATAFGKEFPGARLARSSEEIFEDETIQLITTAAIPSERSTLTLAAMQHGKDVLSDKPGFTTLEQLDTARQIQKQTGRIYAILYGERMENPATIKAGELVKAGAIGDVIQTMGWGPHRIGARRDDWFYDREKYGGILCDIGAHQADQFLYFTGSKNVQIIGAQVGNIAHSDEPGLEDFGEAMLRGDGGNGNCAGYFRCDWFTPEKMPAFGDCRLFVIGTKGTIEVRKYCDVGGREGGNHLFLVNGEKAEYVDCSDVKPNFGSQFLSDVENRTQTACSQEEYFAAAELSLRAQNAAQTFGNLS